MAHFALILSLFLAAAPSGAAATPSPDDARLHGDVSRLLTDLNSDRFEVRQKAAEQLEKMVNNAELRRGLATEFQRALVRPDLSFEVRRQLERWSRRLPRPSAEPVPETSPNDLDKLIRQLDDDSYTVRLGASRRIEWLLGNPKLICPILLRLKQRLTDESLDREARQRIEAAWQFARGAWLSSDIDSRELPTISDERIGQWLDDLARPGSSAATRAARDAASCELLDLMARDDCVSRLTNAVRARLERKPPKEAATLLQGLLDWTKPEIVAEYWKNRHQEFEQHLLVGVPISSAGGTRPTCFDRVNDRIAHCSSGNALLPGEYPVGKAFPHPRQPEAFFHLVSLPTPRQRMAYLSAANTDEPKRLAALSRRTLDGLRADKRPLSETQLLMLAQLDPTEVSRFAGKYFMSFDDRRLGQSGPRRIGGRPSQFGMICARLAVDGGKEAMPGLTEAIAKNRFVPPTLLSPYRLELLAALSIAARDPWMSVDAWLAELLGDTELLMIGRNSGPEIGATAAALLLKRHGQTPANFGLQPAPEGLIRDLHVDAYRFKNDQMRKKVIDWWKQQSNRKAS
jgi:hypothetical protein